MIGRCLLAASVAAFAMCSRAGLGKFPERETVVASGPWEMAQASAPDRWMPAKVPGTVLGTLVANKVVPDPYWGMNNRFEDKVVPDLSAHRDFYTATFRTRVELPADFAGKTVWMRPEGINYRSEIYLNGKLAASTAGMFARNAVDVSAFVKPGAANDLVVKVWPVDHPGVPIPKFWGAANGEWHNGGDGEIGRNVTMLMSAGWDFTFSDGIRDRNAGIWRDITFFATGDVRLDAPYVRTALSADRRAADLTLELDVHNSQFKYGLAEKRGRIEAEVEGTDVRFAADVTLYRGERRTVFLTARMANPELWWPRNKGAQRLYRLKARFVEKDGKVSDEVGVRFGVRTVTSDQGGKDGARQFYVNGRPVFVRGTNWIPDAMLACDDARMERIMRLMHECGFNLVRLWGGGIVESERFYELCDEYGFLVWQEFWMTGDTRHPDDPSLYLANVEQSVKRIRAHASMCHWTASNESTETSGTEALVKRLTGTTSWMMQSECDGVHDGSPYFSVNPMCHYEDTGSPRGPRLCGFNPEYGMTGLPSAAFLRKFMPECLLWPVEAHAIEWNYRDGGGFNGMTKLHHKLVGAYGAADGIDAYCRRSAAADYMQQRAIWDGWNRARNEATGVLYWYENPPLPQIPVHSWDYDLVQTPVFFATKNANVPLHVAYEYLSNTVSVCSDVLPTHKLSVQAELYDFASRKVWEKRADVTLPGERSVDVFTVPVDSFGFDKPHFVKVRLFAGAREIDAGLYWRSCSRYEGRDTITGPCTARFEELARLPATKLDVRTVSSTAGHETVEVRNAGDKIAFLVHLAPQCRTEEGVHYSDNWFSLLPGEAKTVAVERPDGDWTWTAEVFH